MIMSALRRRFLGAGTTAQAGVFRPNTWVVRHEGGMVRLILTGPNKSMLGVKLSREDARQIGEALVKHGQRR